MNVFDSGLSFQNFNRLGDAGASVPLPQDSRGKGWFSLDSYAGYFDIDTKTVLTRCWKSVAPVENYFEDVMYGVPDLYGPFWIPTTLIFSLFLTSSLSTSVAAYMQGQTYAYDFTRLGAAVSLVYTYYLGAPGALWLGLKYFAGIHERGLAELFALYGYSATVWIGVSWLSLVPLDIFRAIIVIIGTGVSVTFIARNVWPTLNTSEHRPAKMLIGAVAVVHLAVCAGMWFGFLAGGTGALTKGPLPGSDAPSDPVEHPAPDPTDPGVARW